MAGSEGNPAPAGDIVCWTRMQAEAGQTLDDIVARKEIERRAGEGVFLWGVGNAPARETAAYARAGVPVSVVFSIMKSKPRPIDHTPASLLLWRRYIDFDGMERELPPQAFVTSRGETRAGGKRAHYALMCASASPLRLQRGVGFDPSAFRNVGPKGGPVGASQVTALLRRVAASGPPAYEANLTAGLVGSYWVRLTDPVVIAPADLSWVGEAVRAGSPAQWLRLVADLRAEPHAGRARAE